MNDLEIAKLNKMTAIDMIAKKLELDKEEIINYGNYKAKINLKKDRQRKGRLILVTAINPTPYGEGKTTVSIGLADALNKYNNTILALRQPSMGPVFGMKGGATGGGYSQVVPMDDINLHFTGDFHAITAANNLLSAAIDNHIFYGNDLNINPEKIVFERCLDVNDRALRNINISRNETFNITAASEIMAIFTLAKNLDDLTKKLGNIIIAYNFENKPVFAHNLKIEGALSVILKDAFLPNLVQTLEHTPALIHGGPFANIAHGCNSIVATDLALKLSDYVVTEAGFGSDLGAEKFMNLKCQLNNISPDCIVLVATIKALKYNGGSNKEDIYKNNLNTLKKGIANLERHINHLKQYNKEIVVAINKYTTDTVEEIDYVKKYIENLGVLVSTSTAYVDGGNGALELSEKVIEACNKSNEVKYIYTYNQTIHEKIKEIATKVYGATDVEFTDEALKQIKNIEKLKLDKVPICIAKTQYSLTDDAKFLGSPKDFNITVRGVKLYNGAGFITVLLGNILTMPGLPKVPNYEKIKLENNEIVGIF